eukprot:1254917-Pleurochrysis_carterae.AAC.4
MELLPDCTAVGLAGRLTAARALSVSALRLGVRSAVPPPSTRTHAAAPMKCARKNRVFHMCRDEIISGASGTAPLCGIQLLYCRIQAQASF